MKKVIWIIGIFALVICLTVVTVFVVKDYKIQKLQKEDPLPANIVNDYFITYGLGQDTYIFKGSNDGIIYNKPKDAVFAFNNNQAVYYSSYGDRFMLLMIIEYCENAEDIDFMYGKISACDFSECESDVLGSRAYNTFVIFDTQTNKFKLCSSYNELQQELKNKITEEKWFTINQFYYIEATKYVKSF